MTDNERAKDLISMGMQPAGHLLRNASGELFAIVWNGRTHWLTRQCLEALFNQPRGPVNGDGVPLESYQLDSKPTRHQLLQAPL